MAPFLSPAVIHMSFSCVIKYLLRYEYHEYFQYTTGQMCIRTLTFWSSTTLKQHLLEKLIAVNRIIKCSCAATSLDYWTTIIYYFLSKTCVFDSTLCI